MARYDLGDALSASVQFTSPAGAPVDAQFLTCTITAPDQNVNVISLGSGITHLGTGLYAVTIPATESGVYQVLWAATGSFSSTFYQSFTVDDEVTGLLVSAAEVVRWAGKTSTQDDLDFLTALIEILQGELQTYLGRNLFVSTISEVQTLADDQCNVFLRQTPVNSVASVQVAGQSGQQVSIDPNSYIVWPWGVQVTDPTYSLVFTGNNEFWQQEEGTQITINYVGGLPANSLPAIRGAIIRAAGREWLARLSDVQNVKNLHAGRLLGYQFNDGNAGGFTIAEKQALRRYKRRVVV